MRQQGNINLNTSSETLLPDCCCLAAVNAGAARPSSATAGTFDVFRHMDSATAKEQSAVMRALKYPFSGMLQKRKERAAEQQKQKQQGQSSVEMLDFTSSMSSYHRKTHSDSSVGTTDSQEGL